MIILKGQDEAAIVARIEKELKGEEVDIFQSNDTEYSMEEVLGFLGYNAKQARVYIGRIERNSRRIEEDIRDTNKLLEPISIYFSTLLEDMLPDHMLTYEQKRRKAHRNKPVYQSTAEQLAEKRAEIGPKAALVAQRELAEQLRKEGKAPE